MQTNMIAAGSYLRALRKAHDLSRAEVAARSGTNEAQIIRIEKGEIDTRGSLLMRLIRAVQGNPEHVVILMLDDEATPERAHEMALQWFNREVYEADSFINSIEKPQRQEVLAILDELESADAQMVPKAVQMLRALLGR